MRSVPEATTYDDHLEKLTALAIGRLECNAWVAALLAAAARARLAAVDTGGSSNPTKGTRAGGPAGVK